MVQRAPQGSISSGDGVNSREIEDHGPGILPQNLPRIFDPFYTTKKAGTGLGLAIVHRIVEAHGGQVAVESKPGVTRFSVALPLAQA